MADKNCSTELNKQLQGLQARLSQAENNLTATYIGISQLVTALAATPASAAAAVMSPIYNLSATGFDLQQKLISLLSPVEIKKLMMNMASGLIDTMGAELDSVMAGMVAAAEESVVSATANVLAAEEALAAAILGGVQGTIDAAQVALDAANAALQTATDFLAISSNFMQGQSDAAHCKSFSAHFS